MILSRTRLLLSVLFIFSACGSQTPDHLRSSTHAPRTHAASKNPAMTADELSLLKSAGGDELCEKRVPSNLRVFFFKTFRDSAHQLSVPMGENEVIKFSKVIGMSLKESSGASAAVTDMHGNGSRETLQYFFRTDNPGQSTPSALRSSLQSANQLMKLRNVRWDHQTNFGLLQMSADRFSFHNEATVKAHEFVGRMQDLFRQDPAEVIELCGTQTLFKNGDSEIREAFTSMQTCELGMSNAAQIRCFGNWAMLCPRYNVALALGAPASYFATRKTAPLCAKSLRSILIARRH